MGHPPLKDTSWMSSQTIYQAALQSFAQGNIGTARHGAEMLLEHNPQFAPALQLAGLCLHAEGDWEAAIELLRRAEQADPTHAEYPYNLGAVYYAAGRLMEAAAAYRRVLTLQPSHPETLVNLGVVLVVSQQAEEGVTILEQAQALRPQDAAVWNNLGHAYEALGRTEDALAAYEQALALNSGSQEILSGYAKLKLFIGDPAAALRAIDQVLSANPDDKSLRWYRALCLLMMGRYAEGWPEYEWRFDSSTKDRPGVGLPAVPMPRWWGEPLAGKRLLVLAEQGVGDVLQFARYLPLLQGTGGHVSFACNTNLHALLQPLPGVDALVDLAALFAAPPAVGDYDYHVPLMSLPLFSGIGEDQLPAPAVYLGAPAAAAAVWQQRADRAAGGQLKVGLVWAGNPAHINDVNRSAHLSDILPLLNIPGVACFSLQKAPPFIPADLPAGLRLVDFGTDFDTFSDTAAAVAAMDLIVSVDTSVAHLAGGMGKPVLVLLPRLGLDWRWLLDVGTTPWYPSMRLFRQEVAHDWSSPVAAVRTLLMHLAAARQAAPGSAR
jgi:Flp pilus assembly protein TadD